MKEIQQDCDLELQLIATGMHLSPEFGLTWHQIEEDGFSIDRKIEMLLSSDTSVGISKSMGLAMVGLADAFEELKPDIAVVLGDRFETFAAASVALVARIPLAHIHGGETTEGAYDEAFRHSITKMSHLHFTATDEYKRRVIQLGENPEDVYNFGGIGLDNIVGVKLLSKEEFEESIGFVLNNKNLLVTFHSVTLESESAETQFQSLLNVLDGLENTNLIFTKPNADSDGRVIIQMIDRYVSDHPQKSKAFISLGQFRYLSALQFVDAVIGNSSSGLGEAPSFQIGTVNIGDRQKGRLRADSVIDCEPTEESISSAIEVLYSRAFQKKLKSVKSPYGEGGTSIKIKEVLKNHILQGIQKKTFHDLNDFSVT